MCSSVVIVTRKLWDDVGGFDESFAGWGFEDNAFAAACETFSDAPVLKMPGELWHLWHATAKEGKRGTPTHTRNKARADLYLQARGDRDAIRALRNLAQPSFEHRPTGIPRILHRVVPAITDDQVEQWWAEIGRMHPDWELMTHRDPLVPAEWPETAHKWADCANGAQLADLVRLEALLRWGGIYLDSDVEPFRPLDPLLPLSAFAAWEDERSVPNAVMGAVPSHPAIRECLDLALSRIPGPVWPAGPGVLTEILPRRDDVLLLPPGSFYPVHYRDPDRDSKMDDPALRKRNPWSFVLHRYAGSWLAPK
jgi:mannosyltransferase OCH1-like enzyme